MFFLRWPLEDHLLLFFFLLIFIRPCEDRIDCIHPFIDFREMFGKKVILAVILIIMKQKSVGKFLHFERLEEFILIDFLDLSLLAVVNNDGSLRKDEFSHLAYH
jgi:hypothetical protein